MKRFCKNFVFTEEYIRKCLSDCLKRRWRRKDVAYFLAGYAIRHKMTDKSLHDAAKSIRHYVYSDAKARKNVKKTLFPVIAKDLLEEINNKCIPLRKIHYQNRTDKASGKERRIGIASIKQQVYDYIVINAIKPMLDAKIGPYQCASMKGRGQIFGKKAIERWIRKDEAATKYYCKEDIYHYYPSIPRDRLKKLLARDIKNEAILKVIYRLLDTYEEGLCIGSYLCQYLANYYLPYAWHYIDNHCYTLRRGKRINMISKKLFYMDDIILFSPNLKNLKKARKMLHDFLKRKLGIRFKSENNYHRGSETIDMMGYKITRTHTTIRKRNWKRIRRLLVRYKNKARTMCRNVANKIISRNGMIKNSDSVMISRKYNIKRTLNRAKEVIRCEAKAILPAV